MAGIDKERVNLLTAWLTLCFSVSVVLAVGQQAPPLLTAPVNDFASIIDQATEVELDRRIRALQQATGDVVVVATVDTFGPFATIEEFAVRMFENGGRGIGEKGRDNGALVVLALQEREVRIEVGYDLEEFITDGYAGETIRLMVPEFRTGGYGRGLLAGTTRLINRIAERRNVALQDVPSARQPVQPPASNVWPIIVLIWLFVIMASSRRRRRRGRRWGGGPWSGWNSGVGPFGGGGFGAGGFGGGFGGFGSGGGGGGGGFGGFGGGRSGGGGASGRW